MSLIKCRNICFKIKSLLHSIFATLIMWPTVEYDKFGKTSHFEFDLYSTWILCTNMPSITPHNFCSFLIIFSFPEGHFSKVQTVWEGIPWSNSYPGRSAKWRSPKCSSAKWSEAKFKVRETFGGARRHSFISEAADENKIRTSHENEAIMSCSLHLAWRNTYQCIHSFAG